MQDVIEAENEAERLEATVYAEMLQLQAMRREVETYLSRARRVAEDSALRSYLDGVSVPATNADAPINEARAARMKAVATRKACVKALAARLDAHQGELERLSERMAEEESAAKQRTVQKAAAVVERAAAAAERAKPAAAAKAEEPDDAADIVSAFHQATSETVITKAPTAPSSPAPGKKAKTKPSVTVDERRVAQRIALCTEITLGSDSNLFTGFTGDISEGGVFMATVEVMPIGTTVDVSFTLPSGAKVEAKGEVRWVRELDVLNPDQFPGMGIHFTQVPASSVAAIHQFANEREPMFFPD